MSQSTLHEEPVVVLDDGQDGVSDATGPANDATEQQASASSGGRRHRPSRSWEELLAGDALKYDLRTGVWRVAASEVASGRVALATQEGLIRVYKSYRAYWSTALVHCQARSFGVDRLYGAPGVHVFVGPNTSGDSEKCRRWIARYTSLIAEARRLARYISDSLERHGRPRGMDGDEEETEDDDDSEDGMAVEVMQDRRRGKRRRAETASEGEGGYEPESSRNVRARPSGVRSRRVSEEL
jgi:hypothetical protein